MAIAAAGMGCLLNAVQVLVFHLFDVAGCAFVDIHLLPGDMMTFHAPDGLLVRAMGEAGWFFS